MGTAANLGNPAILARRVSLFCRHNRHTADCPICSKEDAARRPARPAPARPAAAGQGEEEGLRSEARTVSGLYAAAGPYEDDEVSRYEVRLERVPGGLRLAEWPLAGGQLRRRAPVLEAADLPGLVERAIEQGVVSGADAEKLTAAVAAESGKRRQPRALGRLLGGAAGRAAGGRARCGSAAGSSGPGSGWELPGDAGDAAGGAFRRGLRGRGVRCLGTSTTLTS